MHVVDPVAAAYAPIGQSAHELNPAVSANWPCAQLVRALADAAEKSPAAQLAQAHVHEYLRTLGAEVARHAALTAELAGLQMSRVRFCQSVSACLTLVLRNSVITP